MANFADRLTAPQAEAFQAASFADLQSVLGNERKVRVAKVSALFLLNDFITEKHADRVVTLKPEAFAYFCQIRA